jgi:hypothetical protein
MPQKKVDGLRDSDINRSNEEKTDKSPEEPSNPVTRDELIEQLDLQIGYFERLPQHEKFAFCTNADLAYFMLLIAGIIKSKK